MITFYASSETAHNPPHEFFEGQLVPYQECPQRMGHILEALAADGRFPVRAPVDHGLAPIEHIHDSAYLNWLQRIYANWVATGGIASGAVADTFALRGLPNVPANPRAAHGYYSMDATSVVTAGTWRAAYDAAQSAVSAVEHVLAGALSAYALCRPPGHHAHRSHCGGYCFLNNAAIAAGHAATHSGGKVTVLDVDFHHGNGTQDIFYERDDVQFVSIHADPERHYPYFSGARGETGRGRGVGCNSNYPLPAGVDDRAYLSILSIACDDVLRHKPELLVVSLGLDTFKGDPLGDFELTTAGFVQVGHMLRSVGLPTVFVQEGGYSIAQLGQNVRAVLDGFLTADSV